MPDHGIPLGDILDDSGYSHRDADAWALPLRAAGAQLRCPLRPASMTLDQGGPEILKPPEHPQACCTQQTMGLTPLMLFTVTPLVVRNQRILHAWNARQQENQRPAAEGLVPKTRKRRRKTLASLAAPP